MVALPYRAIAGKVAAKAGVEHFELAGPPDLAVERLGRMRFQRVLQFPIMLVRGAPGIVR